MKKFMHGFILLMLVISIFGCGNKNSKEEKETNKFDMKKAEKVVNEYMRAYILEDYIVMEKYLGEKIALDFSASKASTRIVGYSVEESMLVGENGLFKIKVSSMSKAKVGSELDSYNMKISLNDKSEYVITEIKISAEKEAFYEDFGLRLRNKSSANTDLLIDFDSFPIYAYSKEDNAKVNRIELPREHFGVINFGFSGDIIAVSTDDKISYCGIVKIGTDSVATANGQSGKDGGDQGSSKQGGSGASIREKPVGKEIMSLDVLSDSKINFMTFSPDEKFLLVQYTNVEGTLVIKMYNVEKGELIPFNFIKYFNSNNLNLTFNYFDNDNLIYKVEAKNKSEKYDKNIEGLWKLSLKDFETQRY